jgi:hypothetical protein
MLLGAKMTKKQLLQLILLTIGGLVKELTLQKTMGITSKVLFAPPLSHQAVESVFNLVLRAPEKSFAHTFPSFPHF